MAKRKNPAAQALGKLGAKARMTKLTKAQRSAIARHAVQARWAKAKGRSATDMGVSGTPSGMGPVRAQHT